MLLLFSGCGDLVCPAPGVEGAPCVQFEFFDVFFFDFGRAGAPRCQDAGTACAQLLRAKVVRMFLFFFLRGGAPSS